MRNILIGVSCALEADEKDIDIIKNLGATLFVVPTTQTPCVPGSLDQRILFWEEIPMWVSEHALEIP